jgi:hypothetical protein
LLYFSGKVSNFCLRPLWTEILPPTDSQTVMITGSDHHALLTDWDGVSLIFCLDWSWVSILLIFTSWVAGDSCWPLQVACLLHQMKKVQNMTSVWIYTKGFGS